MPTSDAFFRAPILNSPYEVPDRHWQLNADGQPTPIVDQGRRRVDFTSAIPKPKRKRAKAKATDSQADLGFGESDTKGVRYDTAATIEAVRRLVSAWRLQADTSKWGVTPHTARLLQHWRRKDWEGRRPFFCQVEAVETLIWLTEVAPRTSVGKELLDRLEAASRDANPLLERFGFKLATGAGKTTVMAMMIAWQTVNAVRMPTSTRFTTGFLIVAPGITIRDRLRVLMPNDPEAYYAGYNLVPHDMLGDMGKAKIVITNYHAFMPRETQKLAKGTRELLQGRRQPIDTLETPGQMLKRAADDLLGMKGIMVINDEAHHCYRARPDDQAEGETVDQLKGDEKKEAKAADEEARVWISGLEAAAHTIGINKVIDLSATPFFLKGSGYVEGTLFPWVVSDFSLMDAIECGIVKLPRVPVSDNIPSEEVPVFRDLWAHVGKKMPKKGRGKGGELNPQDLPTPLKTALAALYGHYETTFVKWEADGIKSPPCFIIVCNNTASSKLVYDYVSGYQKDDEEVVPGALDLFSNFDNNAQPHRRPRTLLIDSKQLESGNALDTSFRKAALREIDLFAREMRERGGQQIDVTDIDEATLLREVMNTVGKPGKLGGSIRCVVSVSMLTEGWDANNVTHIVGVRAFGTQLLCEQVMGRALRRWSYDLNEDGRFDVEYADILGIPFDFAAEPVKTSITAPKEKTHVHAVKERRDGLEMRFPRVIGYRVERPPQRFEVTFTEEDVFRLSPKHVGPTQTQNYGVIGEGIDLTLEHTRDTRESTIVLHLTSRLLMTKFQDGDGEPEMSLYGSLKRVVKSWLDTSLECVGGTYPAQLLYTEIADQACELINNAITRSRVAEEGEGIVRAILDPFNPSSTTSFVSFYTTKPCFTTDPRKCVVNYAVEDSAWEAELCRVLESHPRVLRYVKNQALGFEVPYVLAGQAHQYTPDFLVDVIDIDEEAGPEAEPLHLTLEVKGYRGDDAVAKANTMISQWIPAVNANGAFGRWAFAELREPFGMEADLNAVIAKEFEKALAGLSPKLVG